MFSSCSFWFLRFRGKSLTTDQEEQSTNEITDGTAHVDALSSALADFGKKVRADIDTTDELDDKDTADLFTEISRNVDKLLWFVEAHIQA